VLEVVTVRICEVVKGVSKPPAVAKPKPKKPRKRDERSEFEKNAAKLRSKERKLKPQKPIPPVKHYDGG
jgi:hypothetical protein